MHPIVLFDFDGVLCKGRFYASELLPDHAGVYGWIQRHIFGDQELVHGWMRGAIGAADINALISAHTGVAKEELDAALTRSVEAMVQEIGVLDVARAAKTAGARLGLVTDNMDVFSTITVRRHGLAKLFDVIVNSADYGLLKQDEGGALFDRTLAQFGGARISDSVLIDDSTATIALYAAKGGHAHHYQGIDGLRAFLGLAAI